MTQKKQLLIVDRYFHPDLQASSVILTDLALQLTKHFNVSVLCGPASSFREETISSSKDIKIQILPVFQFNNPNLFERFLNYSSFLLLAPLALLFAQRPHVLLVQSSPPLLPFVVSVVCAIKQIPYIYVCQDLFPGTALRSGQLKENFFTHFSEKCHLFAARRAFRVVAIGSDMKKLLVAEGLQESHIEVIPNWADSEIIKPAPRKNPFSEKYGLTDHFVVMHSGNFGLVQDFDFMLEIAKELSDEPNIRMVFVGGGASKSYVQERVQTLNLTNVIFIPFAPKEAVSQVLSSADLQLVSLKPGISGYSVPSKTYALLAAGSAMLGLVEKESEVAHLIEDANCGFVIEKRNALKAAEIIKELSSSGAKIADWKINSKNYSDKMNFKHTSIAQYHQLLSEAAT